MNHKPLRGKFFLLLYVIVAYTILLTYAGGPEENAYERKEYEKLDDTSSSTSGRIDGEGAASELFGGSHTDIGDGKFQVAIGEGNCEITVFGKNYVSENIGSNNHYFVGEFTVTAYTLREEECGKDIDHPLYGQPAISQSKYANFETVFVKENHTIAADWEVLMPGSAVIIEGLPYIYRVEDKGGAIKENRIDIYMNNLDEALEWGVQERKVWVLNDGRLSDVL